MMISFSLMLGISNIILMALLVYFAYKQISKLKKQIDGFKKDVETSRLISFTDQAFKLHGMIIEYPELMKIFKGLTGFESFDFSNFDSEKAQRTWYIIMNLTFHEQMLEQHKKGTIDKEFYDSWSKFLMSVINECPEWKEVYMNTHDYWNEDFRKDVDARIQAITKNTE